jgi:hypothetical protein
MGGISYNVWLRGLCAGLLWFCTTGNEPLFYTLVVCHTLCLIQWTLVLHPSCVYKRVGTIRKSVHQKLYSYKKYGNT